MSLNSSLPPRLDLLSRAAVAGGTVQDNKFIMSGRRNPQKKEKIEIEIVDKQSRAQQRVKPKKKTEGRKVPRTSDGAAVQVVRPKPGNPMLRELSPSLASQNTLAHMMSVLNPWDEKYNGAKVPNPAPVDSAVFKTHEVIVVGTPTVAPAAANTDDMVFTGFGGFVMRPNTLGRQYQYTPGDGFLGWNKLGNGDPGLVAFTLSGGNQTLVFNMIGTQATQTIPMPNTDLTVPGWLSPYAMEDIIQLCSKYRVVSAGLVCRYIGPPITGSGMLAAGTIPYTQLEVSNIDATNAGEPFPYTSIDWQSFINLKDVVTCPATKGINMVYVPKDTRAMDWKQTVLTFPLPVAGALPGQVGLAAHQVKRHKKRGTLHKFVQQQAAKANLKAELQEDGHTVKLSTAATFTKTVDKNGKVIKRRVDIENQSKPAVTPSSPLKNVGVLPMDNEFMIPWFHGNENPLDGEAVLLQPEDTEAGLAAVFAQAAFGGYGFTNPGDMDQPLSDDVNNFLNMYADSSWSEAEDIMCIMWNGIAPADAVLAAGATDIWSGNLFEIDKYVNYEAILDLNSLDIGSMPASPGSFGSPSAGPAIAQQVRPTTALVGKPKPSESWIDKAGNWLSNAKDKVEPWISAGSKAIQVATAIADVLGAIL